MYQVLPHPPSIDLPNPRPNLDPRLAIRQCLRLRRSRRTLYRSLASSLHRGRSLAVEWRKLRCQVQVWQRLEMLDISSSSRFRRDCIPALRRHDRNKRDGIAEVQENGYSSV